MSNDDTDYWKDFDFDHVFGDPEELNPDYLGPDGQPPEDPQWEEIKYLERSVRYLETQPYGTLEVAYLSERGSPLYIDQFPLLPGQDRVAVQALENRSRGVLEELARELVQEKYVERESFF